jgi:CheY-like chemotaxis protein
MVLGMLQEALSSMGEVAVANDAADALLKAVDDLPDILISDYRMPGMDGRQLLEKLKSRPATAGIAVILMASKADISERLSMQDPIEDYLEKPFFLKDATHKIKRVVDRIALEKLTKAESSDGILRGSLAQMNVIDLVQSLEMGRKSCLLSMSNGNNDERCEIYFNQGQVNHAVYGAVQGDQAVFNVLRWTDGNFQIDFNGKSSLETTTLNTQGLLMEGLRLLDEAQRDATAEGEDVLLDT